MEKSHFSLTWDKFHSSMCAGFSLLQQNGELVDLTLAADGHFVKVHQIVLSIASPFVKDLIQSVDCKHPVIFLNNVSFKTLCSILEYVYSGEVSVEENNLNTFLEAAKSLQIRGLDEMFSTTTNDQSTIQMSKSEDSKISVINFDKMTMQSDISSNNANRTTEDSKQLDAVRGIPRKRKSSSFPEIKVKKEYKGSPNKEFTEDSDEDDSDSGSDGDNAALDSPDSFGNASEDVFKTTDNKDNVKPTPEFQYTVSNRGSLQMILNRFMYNLCSRGGSAAKGPVKRWRCVDYRNHACPASAVTDRNVVIKRISLHNHPFHDKRILNKIERKAVYSAIQLKDVHPDVAD